MIVHSEVHSTEVGEVVGGSTEAKNLNTIIATTLWAFRTIYNPALYAVSGAVRLF